MRGWPFDSGRAYSAAAWRLRARGALAGLPLDAALPLLDDALPVLADALPVLAAALRNEARDLRGEAVALRPPRPLRRSIRAR